jgi:hypothetical protein
MMNINIEMRIVGMAESISQGSAMGVEDILTIKMVGMKFSMASKYGALMNRGAKRMKVANTRARVMAEFASLVLSTNMDIIIPIPINPSPTNRRIKNIIAGL